MLYFKYSKFLKKVRIICIHTQYIYYIEIYIYTITHIFIKIIYINIYIIIYVKKNII